MQLARELAALDLRQGNLLLQSVASEKLSRALQQKHAGTPRSPTWKILSPAGESAGLDVGESPDDFELVLAKPRKSLSTAIGHRHDGLDLLRRSHCLAPQSLAEVNHHKVFQLETSSRSLMRAVAQTPDAGTPKMTASTRKGVVVLSLARQLVMSSHFLHLNPLGAIVLVSVLVVPAAGCKPLADAHVSAAAKGEEPLPEVAGPPHPDLSAARASATHRSMQKNSRAWRWRMAAKWTRTATTPPVRHFRSEPRRA